MLYGMYTSGNGMRMQMRRQEVIANNLANANTTGYKRNSFNVKEMGSENERINRLGSQRNDVVDRFGGPEIFSTPTSFEQGNLENTENGLDFALDGEGFFKLRNPSNGDIFYTRSGHFTLNQEGQLVQADSGFLVLDRDDNPILPKEITGSLEDVLKTVNFSNLKALEKREGTLFTLQKDSNGQLPFELPTTAHVLRGYLEGSNTSSINEMVQMIEAHRVYQANASNLRQQDENLGKLISIARS